jgi:hypothetical protein
MFMDAEHLTILSRLYDKSCQEVFDTLCGVFTKVDSHVSVPSVYSAHIDAASTDLELALVLKGPLEFLQDTHPQKNQIVEIKPEQLIDWVKELANRFMGSLKNELIPYEHSLTLGVPKREIDPGQYDRLLTEFVPLSLFYRSEFGVFESSLFVKILNKEINFAYNDSLALQVDCIEDGELELF